MNPYHHLVSEYARFAKEGKNYPLGKFPKISRPEIPADAPKVLIFSPHPDDEVIIGGIALRMLREAKWNVVNVAVTQGSNAERKGPRLAELRACCDCIGFGLELATANGLDKVTVKSRDSDPIRWAQSVKVIAEILTKHQPRAILVPHDNDWNGSHIGTHFLVMDAMKTMPASFKCHVIETEFWGAMATPNLMVEISPEELADLMTALTFHIGEVQRNPYHLSLPAWMQDNVRRGGELVGGQGAAAPDFVFSTLYRLQLWTDGALKQIYSGGKMASSGQNIGEIFR